LKNLISNKFIFENTLLLMMKLSLAKTWATKSTVTWTIVLRGSEQAANLAQILRCIIWVLVVMGPGQNVLIQVGSGLFFVARLGSTIFRLGLGLKISPKNIKFSIFFPSDKKNQVKKYPGQRQVSLINYCSKVCLF